MRYDTVVNTFAARAVKDNKISVFGGQQERPFVDVRDVSRAIIHAINEDLKGVYNLRSENLSILSLSEILKEITHCKVEIKKEIVDKRSYLVDNSKILKTGFEFEYNIAKAIEEISISPTALRMDKKIYSNLKLAESLKVSELLRKQNLRIIEGNIHIDDRGSLYFANEFNFLGVKRFYQILNFSKSTIRAFHGHLEEAKYFYISKGSAIVAVVKLDDVKSPSKDLEVKRYILSDKKPQILFIPPKYANGFRALENDTRIIIFSTSTLEESESDDFRFPADYWGNEIWEIENR
jgi:dTDP-4-dehydrorhamnose 3,5-epimerase